MATRIITMRDKEIMDTETTGIMTTTTITKCKLPTRRKRARKEITNFQWATSQISANRKMKKSPKTNLKQI